MRDRRWPRLSWSSWLSLSSAGFLATYIWSAGTTTCSTTMPSGTCLSRSVSVWRSSTRPSTRSRSTSSTISSVDTSTTTYAAGASNARSTLATMSKQHCRSNRKLCCLLLRQCCRFGQQCRSDVRLCRKDEISTQNSFDIVAVFGNKVERCFDIVAGVDRA